MCGDAIDVPGSRLRPRKPGAVAADQIVLTRSRDVRLQARVAGTRAAREKTDRCPRGPARSTSPYFVLSSVIAHGRIDDAWRAAGSSARCPTFTIVYIAGMTALPPIAVSSHVVESAMMMPIAPAATALFARTHRAARERVVPDLPVDEDDPAGDVRRVRARPGRAAELVRGRVVDVAGPLERRRVPVEGNVTSTPMYGPRSATASRSTIASARSAASTATTPSRRPHRAARAAVTK